MGGRHCRISLNYRILNPACSGIFYFTSMREELLHFIWKSKKLPLQGLKTQQDQDVQILDFGTHNLHSGPDFLNAKLIIEGQLWVGNIEIHTRSSHWYLHKHGEDRAYDNVILHVVWEYDRPVHTHMGILLPTLVLSSYVQEDLLEKYQRLLNRSKRSFINCEEYTDEFTLFLVLPWMEHVYRERLEQKSRSLNSMLNDFQNDWEKLLFVALLKNFGQQVNGKSFESIAKSFDFSIIRKIGSKSFLLEALLFGQSGILQKYPAQDLYQKQLFQEYIYLKRKFRLEREAVIKPEFMGVRPSSFPTIRLSQFAVLYATHNKLFAKIISANNVKALYDLFQVRATEYWDSHFVFGKKSKGHFKKLSKEFKNSLIINTVIPLAYLHARTHGRDAYSVLRGILVQLKKESNQLTEKFLAMGFPIYNALDSQAVIQLYNEYCAKNRCLECALGNQILN